MKLVNANGKKILKMTKSEWEKLGTEKGWIEAEVKKEKKDVDVEAKKTKGPNKAYPICMDSIQKAHGPKADWDDKAEKAFDSCVEKVKKQ